VQAILACLSRKSVVRKGFVQSELKKALKVLDTVPEGQIFLIPVRLDDCELPDSLTHLHWVNLFEENGLPTLVQALRHFYAAKDRDSTRDLDVASGPVKFSLIRASQNDDNWIDAHDHEYGMHVMRDVKFDIEAKYYFRLKKFVRGADMTLDVTILNFDFRPQILDGIGVEFLEAQQEMYFYGIPEAAKIKLTEEYILDVPLIRGKGAYIEPSNSRVPSVELPAKVMLQIPDPVYMEPKAAYRYGLRLKSFQRNVPNHAVLRLLAKTQDKESYSEPIRTFTW
jgi:hypothetical protein